MPALHIDGRPLILDEGLAKKGQTDFIERNHNVMNLTLITHQSKIARVFASLLLFLTGLVACSGSEDTSTPPAATGTPGAEEAVGERLFLETRFAQAFKVSLHNGGDINDPNIGDRVVDTVETLGTPINPGPFKGLSMNCRACHLVDDILDAPRGGMRTYADFARRSPLPARADGKTVAVRNSPPLVNAALDRPGGVLFHFDAEFNSMEELISATFTGRNFGWLPGERTQAIAHIARVVRSDNGTGDLAKEFDGTPFRVLFGGTDASIPGRDRRRARGHRVAGVADPERGAGEAEETAGADGRPVGLRRQTVSRDVYSALSGALGAWRSLEQVANNLANVNTTGYKKSRPEFEDPCCGFFGQSGFR